MSMKHAMKQYLKENTVPVDDARKTEVINGKRVLVPDDVKRTKLHAIDEKIVPVKKQKARRSPQRISSRVLSTHRVEKAHQRALDSERAMYQNEKPEVEKIALKENTFTQKSNADAPLTVCEKINERFDTPPCPHVLRECNLCGELTYCEHHGCENCSLKAKDDTQALIAAPDEERQMLRVIAEREAAPKPKKEEKNRVHKWRKRDIYDDILALNKSQ